MPSSTPALSVADVVDHVRTSAFRCSERSRIGIELEWNVESRSDSYLRADHDEIERRLHGSLTVEPGGQLEVSSAPGKLPDVLAETHADATVLSDWATAHSAHLVATGLHTDCEPERVLHTPRYAAMEQYFTHGASCLYPSSGKTMMCSTAAVQINLDLNNPASVPRRWQLLDALGPVMIAAFANSPAGARDRRGGWVSNRMRLWFTIDPSRTKPVRVDDDPASAWADYALHARVMCVRVDDDTYVPQLAEITLADWIEHGHPLGFPTLDDVDYHMTTLFPPARPRGWVEWRPVDMLPDPYWQVAPAVASALVQVADVRADEIVKSSAGRWLDAARVGLADDGLADDACRCFRLANDVLDGAGEPALATLVSEYCERFVMRRRSPAHETMEAAS